MNFAVALYVCHNFQINNKLLFVLFPVEMNDLINIDN